jgi:hypothetical protein
LENTPNKPLFTDYQLAIQTIGSKQKASDIMNGMVDATKSTGEALSEERQMSSVVK